MASGRFKTFLEIGLIGGLCFKGESISRILGEKSCFNGCHVLSFWPKKYDNFIWFSLVFKECASKADEYSEPSEALMRALGTPKPLTYQQNEWQKRSCATFRNGIFMMDAYILKMHPYTASSKHYLYLGLGASGKQTSQATGSHPVQIRLCLLDTYKSTL